MLDVIPTIKIPDWLRFVLYLAASVALLLSSYFLDHGYSWWGEPEVKLVQGGAALINILAMAKVTSTAAAVRRATAQGEIDGRTDASISALADSAGVMFTPGR